ncbi:unnamed protein product [Brassica oleracea var. botrytis]
MVSPSSVTPSRRVTRSRCASDREANPKKIPRLGKTASRYVALGKCLDLVIVFQYLARSPN